MGGSESKTKFRGLILRMLENDVPVDELTYWSSIFAFPCTAEDVFVMVPLSDIRLLIDRHPDNLKVLIETAVRLMENYPKQLSILNEPISQSVKNAVRILTRTLPVTFESQGENGFREFWWESGHAVRLMNICMHLLFMPTLTVTAPFSKASELLFNRVDASLLWKPSLASRLDTTKQLNLNRIEVLKLLLAMMSEPIYRTQDELTRVSSLWRFYLTSPACPFVHNLAYSLLYTGLAYDPFGYSWLPYSNRFDRISQEDLSEMSLQTLLVLLDFAPPSVEEARDCSDSAVAALSALIEANSTSEVHSNEVSRCLAAIGTEDELGLLYSAIARILANVVSAEGTYLPGSLKQVKFYHEALMLLWGLLRRNKLFASYILKRNLAQELIVPTLFLMTENMDKREQSGLVYLCVFILLYLSGWREFGVGLNKDFHAKAPAALPLFSGTYADLLIMSLAHIITNGPPTLQAMYSCVFITISNISPYIKTLSLPASAKLMSLLEIFSLKKWLFAGPNNPEIVVYWLEIANNLIQYQWAGCYNLAYQILRKKQIFAKLVSLEIRETHSLEEAKGDRPLRHDFSLTFQHAEEAKAWAPTPEWLQSWKERLPITVVQVLLDKLLPQVEEFCKQRQVKSELEVIDYIRQTSMVGLLPPPHRILMRKYETERSSEVWLSSYLWSNIYLKLKDVPLFDGQKIRLFQVKYAEPEADR